MRVLKNTINNIFRFVLVLLTVGLSFHVCAQNDSYMQELNAEADELDTFDPEAETNQESALEKQENSDAALARKKEFEQALKAELKNTYTVYRMLSPQEKATVVEIYFVNDKKIAVASRQIFNFYFKVQNNK